jgi:signal transduction histidine kinase
MARTHFRSGGRRAAGSRAVRPALATIALCTAGLAVVQLSVVLANDDRGTSGAVAALPAVVGLVYVGAGLLAWGRRPHNRIGALLTAAGLAWIGWGLWAADIPVLTALGLLCGPLPLAITVHLLLAFPSGRLEGRAERIVVSAGYLLIPLVYAPAELLGASRRDDIRVLDVVDDPAVADAAHAIQTTAAAVLLIATAALLVRRLRSAQPGGARAAPLYLAGIVALTVVVLIDALSGAGLTVTGGWPVEVLNAVGIGIVLLLPLAFLAGILRGGFARAGELQELVRRLGDAPLPPDRLAAAVGDALGDPTASLVYWLPGERRYVDAGGAPVELGPGRAAEEVTSGGRKVGAIVYDGQLLRDAEPVRSVARMSGLALDHERLTAELRASARELEASRARLAEASDVERRRIARDLHDGAQQRLVLLAIESELLARRAEDPEAVRRGAGELHAGLDAALDDLRAMIQGLVPPLLAERGLRAAAQELAAQAPIPVAFDTDGDELDAPPHIQSTGYFVINEALVNVIKHAQATSATVSLYQHDGALRIEVTDDGIGGADRARGSGLAGLADRVAAAGGTLDLESTPGAGTRVRAQLPCG